MRPHARMPRGLALLVAAVIIGACSGQDVDTDSFASTDEARQRGAIERGWVPPVVPARAYELRAAYEPDGTRRWGIFNFRIEDREALRASLGDEELPLAGMRVDIPPRIEWWPVALRNELNPDTIAATGLRAYRSRSGGFIVLVNWNQGRGYYWNEE